MAQYNITARSEKKNLTVSNIAQPVIANPEEEGTTSSIPFPSPANYASKAEADAAATQFAEWLNHDDHEGTWDWVGTATTV